MDKRTSLTRTTAAQAVFGCAELRELILAEVTRDFLLCLEEALKSTRRLLSLRLRQTSDALYAANQRANMPKKKDGTKAQKLFRDAKRTAGIDASHRLHKKHNDLLVEANHVKNWDLFKQDPERKARFREQAQAVVRKYGEMKKVKS